MIIKLLKSIFQALQTDISPVQVAFGFALGAFLGFVPGILLFCFFFIVIMILRVNIGAALAGWTLFGLIGLLTDPLADILGFFVLKLGFLQGLWTGFYNASVIPWTNFNNTIVMGNIVLAILLFFPLYYFSKKFIIWYRANYRDKIAKYRIVKILTASSWYLTFFK